MIMAANDGERKAARPSAAPAFRLELAAVSSAVVGLGLASARRQALRGRSATGRGAGRVGTGLRQRGAGLPLSVQQVRRRQDQLSASISARRRAGVGRELRRLAVLHAFLPLCGVGVVCASCIGSGSGSIVPPPEAYTSATKPAMPRSMTSPVRGGERRRPYYVLDNLRNLAPDRRVISRRDDVRQRHCAGDTGESDDSVLVKGHESLIPMLCPGRTELNRN